MRQSILDLSSERVLIADGAIGTELQRSGLEPGACCELWNAERPEKVRSIHRAYMEAGADLITTNSFRGNSIALSPYGLESRARELNRRAAHIAREAAANSSWVIGSIGPLGRHLEPLGEVSLEEGFDVFAEQARALVDGGVDAIIIETMTATDELDLAIRAAREAGAATIIASMAFDKARDGYETMAGVSISQAIEAMMKAGADVVGCNCGANLTMEDYRAIVERMRSCSDKPMIVQPNAGRPELIGNQIIYERRPEAMAEKIESLTAAGASIVGGCCGTRPEHIKLFADKLKAGRD